MLGPRRLCFAEPAAGDGLVGSFFSEGLGDAVQGTSAYVGMIMIRTVIFSL
jgi:hypothetical protein